MPEFGFPAQPRQALISSIVSNLREKSDDARVSSITGRHADITSQLDGRVNELMQIEKSITDLGEYAEIIALSEARTSTMQNSLEQLTTIAQNLSDTAAVLSTNGSDANLEVVSLQAQGELESVISALNVEVGGRSLFAGDDAGGVALENAETIFSAALPFLEAGTGALADYATLEAEFQNAAGLFDTTFYLGGDGHAPTTEVAPGERVNYGIKADDQSIKSVIFNLVVLGAAHDPNNSIPDSSRRLLGDLASSGLRSSLNGITNIQSELGTNESRISSAKSRNIASEASLTLQFNEISNVDNFSSALSLTELENQLETTFLTTARLSNLSLANFI